MNSLNVLILVGEKANPRPSAIANTLRSEGAIVSLRRFGSPALRTLLHGSPVVLVFEEEWSIQAAYWVGYASALACPVGVVGDSASAIDLPPGALRLRASVRMSDLQALGLRPALLPLSVPEASRPSMPSGWIFDSIRAFFDRVGLRERLNPSNPCADAGVDMEYELGDGLPRVFVQVKHGEGGSKVELEDIVRLSSAAKRSQAAFSFFVSDTGFSAAAKARALSTFPPVWCIDWSRNRSESWRGQSTRYWSGLLGEEDTPFPRASSAALHGDGFVITGAGDGGLQDLVASVGALDTSIGRVIPLICEDREGLSDIWMTTTMRRSLRTCSWGIINLDSLVQHGTSNAWSRVEWACIESLRQRQLGRRLTIYLVTHGDFRGHERMFIPAALGPDVYVKYLVPTTHNELGGAVKRTPALKNPHSETR